MKTILLIEDTVVILDNMREFLEMEGYNILAATNGKAGIELAKEFAPDLIICDVRMPEMNGYEVFALLKTGSTATIPFIFCTSNADKMDMATAKQLGACYYITKPFALEGLLNVVRACIEPLK